MISSLHDFCWVWGWKKFENWLTFAKVMGNYVGGRFYETRCMLRWQHSLRDGNGKMWGWGWNYGDRLGWGKSIGMGQGQVKIHAMGWGWEQFILLRPSRPGLIESGIRNTDHYNKHWNSSSCLHRQAPAGFVSISVQQRNQFLLSTLIKLGSG